MVDEGQLDLGTQSFEISVRFNAHDLFEHFSEGREPEEPRNLAVVRTEERLLREAHAVDPELELRVDVYDRSAALGGGFEPPPDVIQVVQTAFELLGAWVTLATVGSHVRKLVDWLAEHYGNHLELSDGAAIVIAAAHLYETYGLTDVTFWFVKPIDSDRMRDGHLVGFRDSQGLHLLAVNARGQTTRLGPPITLADMPLGWGNPIEPAHVFDPDYSDEEDGDAHDE